MRTTLIFAVGVCLVLLLCVALATPASRVDSFWPRFADTEQTRRVYDAGIGVPPKPWAFANMPPIICGV